MPTSALMPLPFVAPQRSTGSVMGILVMIAAIFVLSTGVVLADEDEGEENERMPSVTNSTWKDECGSCHVAFPPALLPSESWAAIMTSLADHFGEDASCDDVVNKEISAFLAANSKPGGLSKPPLRITETSWFNREHDEVGVSVWKLPALGSKANCSGCHPRAADLNYDEDAVKIPQ